MAIIKEILAITGRMIKVLTDHKNSVEPSQKTESTANGKDKKLIDQEKDKSQITKPPKPEDKPFKEFINEYFIPKVTEALTKFGRNPKSIELLKGKRPVVGDECWIVYGQVDSNKRFWLCFSNDNISSNKTISLAESGKEASLIESFLIDERKTTLNLLTSRLLQRLNGQKWLGKN